VLDVLPSDRYQNRLVLGTPLYIEYAHRPEPKLEFPQVASSRWRRVLHGLSRSRTRELSRPPERKMLKESTLSPAMSRSHIRRVPVPATLDVPEHPVVAIDDSAAPRTVE
jgi:hypothetical protein